MGPVSLYTTFLSGATLALFHGSPLGRSFGKFVQVIHSMITQYLLICCKRAGKLNLIVFDQDAGVTFLGTVPSLVKTWKSTMCMEGLDWTKIRFDRMTPVQFFSVR